MTTKLVAALALVLAGIFASGQQIERRVVTKVAPEYSPVLKEKMIGGTVRIVAIVSASGTVQKADIVGGNPILAIAAQKAVKQWKFAPAEKESREAITFNFDPAHPR